MYMHGGGCRYETRRADAVHTQEKFDGTVTLGDAAAPLNMTAKFRGKGSLECQRKSLTVAKHLYTRRVSEGWAWVASPTKERTVEVSLSVQLNSSLLHD
jgi:hypothetical protein